jgi:NAD(P)-dependent dehydrogenase (short-subunit alcohol dehydrogenase family)
MTELNLTLPGVLVSACLPGMMEGRFGRIILFGGWGTERLSGFRELAPYAAAKTGLGVLAASVAKAYAEYNISCTVICPSFVETEYYSSEEKKRYKKRMPGGRMIDPAELADLTEYLVFNSGTLLNGSVIPAGGGFFQ